ncbi:hypothetical protein ADEAN_000373700 [Angomonas deanei]|uniref:Uncharacterized protein n=1 Tax=Angomonas deanei TaxID=59799 RepID=A0A7G2C924_9TRYP|nr:hypothetical protein ADEAN_000373700 [Angomonas deanei]
MRTSSIKESIDCELREVRQRMSAINESLANSDYTAIERPMLYERPPPFAEKNVNVQRTSGKVSRPEMPPYTTGVAVHSRPHPPSSVEYIGDEEESENHSAWMESTTGGQRVDAFKLIQDRLQRKIQMIEEKRRQMKSVNNSLNAPTDDGLLQETHSPIPAKPEEEYFDYPSPNSPCRGGSQSTAPPGDSDSPLFKSSVNYTREAPSPTDGHEVTPVDYTSSETEAEEEDSPPMAQERLPVSSKENRDYSRPTTSFKMRAHSNRTDSEDRKDIHCYTLNAVSSPEVLSTLKPQYNSATVLVSLTGAELFAILRLRGLIYSFSQTNEHLLSDKPAHTMYITPAEYDQLIELRNMLIQSKTRAKPKGKASTARKSHSSAKNKIANPFARPKMGGKAVNPMPWIE